MFKSSLKAKMSQCLLSNALTQELILTKSYARSYNFLLENLSKNRRFLTRSKKILHGNLSQIL